MPRRRLKIFFDGGCRPNPGPMEAAVVVRGFAYLFDDLGFGTSVDAEWLALVRAVELVPMLGSADVELLGDAKAVITQVNAVLKNRHAAVGTPAAFLAAVDQIPPARLRIRWIKRTQNLAGVALAARHPR